MRPFMSLFLLQTKLSIVCNEHLRNKYSGSHAHGHSDDRYIQQRELALPDVDAFLVKNCAPEEASKGGGEGEGECAKVGA